MFLLENGITNFIKKFFTDTDGNNYIFERYFKDIPEADIQDNIVAMLDQWTAERRPTPVLNAYVYAQLARSAQTMTSDCGDHS